MVVLFENINKNKKGNKKFILKILDNSNGNYVVIQQVFACFPDGGEVLQSEKKKISPVSLICERENIRERDKVSYLSEVIFGPQCDQTTRSVDLLAT
uniref:Uncharacterized protein n=2 Tax=Salmonella sp. 40 TaxID=1179813 RepID=I3W3K6_9ENTR|nr:hypothetical protein [Salmonella sp. 40]